MNNFFSVLSVHEFFHLGFPYTNILFLFFTFLLPHGHKLIFFRTVSALPCDTAYKVLLYFRQSWWHVPLSEIFRVQVLLASFPLTSVFICMGRLACKLQKWNSRTPQNLVDSLILFRHLDHRSFCCISFCLRMSLGEEWNNKRTTNRAGVSR